MEQTGESPQRPLGGTPNHVAGGYQDDDEDLPILHIKLDQQQQNQRQLSHPNEQLADGGSSSIDCQNDLVESSGCGGVLQSHTDQAISNEKALVGAGGVSGQLLDH